MKQILFLIVCILFFSANSLAQTSETFDIATFQPPKGWNKQASRESVQFSIEDKATGAYCLVTLMKSLPSPGNSKENFQTAWQTLVKGAVNVAAAPQMFPSNNPEDWALEGGFAAFEKEGEKGVAVLYTISGYGKMVNIMILTNTEAYEPNITAFVESMSLKKPAAEIVIKTAVNPPAATSVPAFASGYGFTTTNFDDGWTSTIQEDWVQVVKGNGKVLVHYPNKVADAYNSVLLKGLEIAWNVLVAPKYSSASDFQYRPSGGWEAIEWAEASAVEIATGKTVYVVLFKKNFNNGSGKYMEFIYPDKSAFEKEIGVYDTSAHGIGPTWDKMADMANYNKFGIAAADLKGKWTNKFSGMTQYVNAYTGRDAGTDTQTSAANFEFGAGQTYKWDLAVASGFVGSIKFQSVKSAGRVTVPSVWQVAFSSIEGKPRTYNAQFSAIKGARILWLDGTAYGKRD